MVFTSVWAGIVLVPLVAAPVNPAGTTDVQLKIAPAVVLLSVTSAVVSPVQIAWLAGEKVITGDGLTVIEKAWEVPGHPLAIGITVIVAVTGPAPLLTGVNGGILPVPVPGRPIKGFVFVHE